MKKQPEDARSPYLVVADDLRAAIAAGQYQPGEKIPSISRLADEYDVVASTVQAALRLLKTEGILEGRQGAGTYVRDKKRGVTDALREALADPDRQFTFSGRVSASQLRAMLDALADHDKSDLGKG